MYLHVDDGSFQGWQKLHTNFIIFLAIEALTERLACKPGLCHGKWNGLWWWRTHTRHTAVEKCTLMMSGDAHRQIFNLGHEKWSRLVNLYLVAELPTPPLCRNTTVNGSLYAELGHQSLTVYCMADQHPTSHFWGQHKKKHTAAFRTHCRSPSNLQALPISSLLSRQPTCSLQEL